MKRKTRVVLLFGGKSAEHEASLAGGWSIYHAVNHKKHDVVLVSIDKKGVWHTGAAKDLWIHPGEIATISLNKKAPTVTAMNQNGKVYLIRSDNAERIGPIDVFFLKTSGPYGEDGKLQGFLDTLDVAYVGAGVLGSAVGMDKDVMKRLLRDAGIPIAKFVVINSHEKTTFSEVKKKLGLPMFVKPANLGSSVGVSKIHNETEFKRALQHAFTYDTKAVIEEFVEGREIECSVLGNEHPIASVPGELVIKSEFYSYKAKYLDPYAMTPQIPAHLPKEVIKKVQKLAIATYKALCCEGMGRVDFFVTPKGKILVNEINTIPGFTSISMYPKMWGASGIPYAKLIDTLIELASERHAKKKKLKTSRVD